VGRPLGNGLAWASSSCVIFKAGSSPDMSRWLGAHSYDPQPLPRSQQARWLTLPHRGQTATDSPRAMRKLHRGHVAPASRSPAVPVAALKGSKADLLHRPPPGRARLFPPVTDHSLKTKNTSINIEYTADRPMLE
jgi:hypothetical protein